MLRRGLMSSLSRKAVCPSILFQSRELLYPEKATPRPFFIILFFAAFGLNGIWEIAQKPAYVEMAERPWGEALPIYALATLGDVAITFAVCGVGALAAEKVRWAMSRRWNVHATAALLGGAIAAAVEWKALASGWWSYSAVMPVVPLLGVGLWPLLQLTLLVPAALWIAGEWARRR